MALTAMTAKDWKESLDFSTEEVPANSSQFEVIHSAQVGGPTGMKEVVEYFKKLNGAKGWGEWEVDQVLFVSF